MNRTSRRILMAAVMAVSALLFTVSCLAPPHGWPEEKFSAEKWRNAQKEHRYVYCKDIVAGKTLNGRSRDVVTGLLGVPDYESPDGRYTTYIVKESVRGEMSFNTLYILQVDFDSGGKAIKVFVRGD